MLEDNNTHEQENQNDDTTNLISIEQMESGDNYDQFEDYNQLISQIIQNNDLSGLHNNLIINDDYMKLNDPNIHGLIMFVYQGLSCFDQQNLQQKNPGPYVLNTILDIGFKTISICYTSIDSQD